MFITDQEEMVGWRWCPGSWRGLIWRFSSCPHFGWGHRHLGCFTFIGYRLRSRFLVIILRRTIIGRFFSFCSLHRIRRRIWTGICASFRSCLFRLRWVGRFTSSKKRSCLFPSIHGNWGQFCCSNPWIVWIWESLSRISFIMSVMDDCRLMKLLHVFGWIFLLRATFFAYFKVFSFFSIAWKMTCHFSMS